MKILHYNISLFFSMVLLVKYSLTRVIPKDEVCPVGGCAKCNIADDKRTCDDCYYTLKNLQDGSMPHNFFCEGTLELDNCLQLQNTLAMDNISDTNKCNQCMPGYNMTDDQTYKCKLMKIQYCWYSAGKNSTSNATLEHYYNNREKLGLYHYFEQTQLQKYGFQKLGYHLPGSDPSQEPCFVCGPNRIPTEDGLSCVGLSNEQKIDGCGLYHRSTKDPNVVECHLCIAHYYITKDEKGFQKCAYDKKLSACIDPIDLDENKNCKRCDAIRGYWAVGLSQNSNGEVTGNICEYQRSTDQLRTLLWPEVLKILLGSFLIISLVIMIVCCYMTYTNGKPPKESTVPDEDPDGLEEDLMIKSFAQQQETEENDSISNANQIQHSD